MSEFDRTLEDLDELIVGNPAVDTDQVGEATRLIEELRDSGMPRPEYNIESPYKVFPRRATS